MIQDHMVPNINGLDSSGHPWSFLLSLLPGPSAHLPCDLQQALDLKSVPISHQVAQNHGTANGFSAGSRVSVLPGALRQHNMDSHSLISGEIFFPFISSKSTANCSNSSALLHAPNLNFQKSQAVASQNTREQDKIKSFSSLIGSHDAFPIYANRLKLQEYGDIAALQDIPVENNFTSCHHGHNPSSSFPRVFCSGISGNLLLSDTGLLGVVCSCHGLYMSISKFSEHSGSSDVNPGNAVRMDNGETVAHWWKTLISQSGVLEGQRGWDWPEAISATSGVTNCPVSNLSNNTVLLNQVGPFRTSVSYEQQQHSIMNAKENWSSRSVVEEYAYHGKDRISQECSNSLLKCFFNGSDGRHHAGDQKICGLRNSSSINTEKVSQFTTVKLDPICESANSLHANPNIQDLKKSFNGFNVGRNTSLIVEGPQVSPRIGSRLGRPPEQSQTTETKVLNAYGSSLNGMHAEPPKVISSDRLQWKSNELQGSKWTLDYADIGFSPSELEGSSNVGGPYGAVSDYQKDSYDGNLEMTDHSPLLLSCFMNPSEKWQFRNTYVNGSDSHVVGEKLHYRSHASKSEKVCFPWSRVGCSIKDFDTNVSNAKNHMSRRKGVECAVNGLLGTAKPSTESSKRLKEDMKTFNVVVDESSSNYSPAFHEKSPKLHQMSTMIVDESLDRDTLHDCWKISSHSDIKQFNHDSVKPIHNSINSEETASMGCKTSFFVQSATPISSTKKYNGINPNLQDQNMEMPEVRNMLGLSDGDNGPVSVRKVQYSEILRKPCVQSLLTISPSMSKDHVPLLDFSRTAKIPEVGEKLTLPGSICWTGHNSETYGTMTGRSFNTEDSDLPPVEQLFVRPGGIEWNLTHSKKEQFSQGLPYACVPKNCSCTVQANCLTGKYDLNGDACCTLTKKGDRAGAPVATTLFNSNLTENCIFHEKGTKTLEKTQNFVAPKMKRVESHSFQWRDVPGKIMETCSSKSKEQEAVLFNTSLVSPAADGAKCFTGFAQNIVPLQEHEISNISSGCSAPDMTQLSIEVNKKDSCTVEGRDIKCVNNLGLDEGSQNDRTWSSDDALDNENCAEFLGSPSTINLIKSGPLKYFQTKPSLGLIEEIRIQNSLGSENAPNQIKRSSTIQAESGPIQKFDMRSKKRRKTVKWMKLDAPICVSGKSSFNYESPKCTEEVGQNAHSFGNMPMPDGCDQVSSGNFSDSVEQCFKQRKSAFLAAKGMSIKSDLHKVYHQAEQQTIEAHKSFRVCDPLETTDMFRKKRLRSDDSKKFREIFCNSAELTAKLTSSGCPSNSLVETNFCKWMARPTVFGKYGIISNGNPSKPTKIIPLRKIFKIAASHAGKSNKTAKSIYHHDKLKSASVKVKRTSVRHAKEMYLSEKVLKGQVRKGGANVLLPIELEPCRLNAEIETASCFATNGNDDLSKTSNKSNTYGITHGIPGYDLKRKCKESRKRSLSELLVKGNGFKDANSSIMKNSTSVCQTTGRCLAELMEDDAGDTVQTNEMHNCTRYSEKHKARSSDMFSCVCGNSDRDESDQLLECNRFLIKGLGIKAEAANNEDISFNRRCMLHASSSMFIPDSDGESLPLGAKVACARTEGYKGRKREGFLHNHPQDANGNAGCLVPQEQLNAWLHIHQQKPLRKGRPKFSSSSVGSDCRKAYTRYRQAKGWKHLVVYKSGIHALGLYTSVFISCGAMVVEYVGEIVGLRVADRRESEYHSGKKLQHKSACYFFRIDKEHIIDATRKGGIARFVNHSCQVVFFAERDIFAGEEITYDYHFNHEDEEESPQQPSQIDP
ncbi:UNVERIFIED_CONTAM: Histone-lysine N-methyltransferase, H3 lysine-4 specific [Sesamum latifolium]|uniref:Histone-lysine N-methyltransferase, H3 lysine-4 specific n=1 Tax=Sesamum latifolium TaxID=2727402 RepID=A0AAW2SPF1_9LAMI